VIGVPLGLVGEGQGGKARLLIVAPLLGAFGLQALNLRQNSVPTTWGHWA
jgi:hypothetical protein